MDRDLLEELLAQGLSLDRIGERVGRHPSTVSYWLKKHGLRAVKHDQHAPKGGMDRATLQAVVESGASIQEIADHFGRGATTVRYWLKRFGLATGRGAARIEAREKLALGERRTLMTCRRHGLTAFWLERRGSYRCLACRSEAVSRRRRRVKEILVREAGGRCQRCGYDAYLGALEFHHLDRALKSFALSQGGFSRALAKARAESAKCVLLCANCHAEVEAGRFAADTLAAPAVAGPK